MEDKSLTNKLMDLIEFAGDGILLGDEKGYLIMANKKMSSISGYDNHELLGKHISFLFSDDELKNKPFQFEKLKQVGNILTTRNLIDRHGNATPVEMHSGNYDDGYISIIRDLQEKLNNKNQIKD